MSFLTHMFAIVVLPFVAVAGIFFGHHQPTQLAATSTAIVASSTQPTLISTTTPITTMTPTVKVQSPTIKNLSATQNNISPAATIQNSTATSPSLDTNAADIADFSNTINTAVNQLQTLESSVGSFSSRVNSDSAEISPSVPSFVSLASQTLTTNNALVIEIQSYITTLKTSENKAVSSGAFDKQYWQTTGIQEIVSTKSEYTQQALSLEQLYEQGLLSAEQALKSQPVTQPQSAPQPTPNPAQMYIDCATENSKAYQEVLSSMSGFATQSQINALVNNKMASDGYGYCFYLQ